MQLRIQVFGRIEKASRRIDWIMNSDGNTDMRREGAEAGRLEPWTVKSTQTISQAGRNR